MRGLSIGLLVCACGNAPMQRTDASVDVDAAPNGDAQLDAPTDAMSGFTIGGTALGIRSTVVLTLTTGGESRNVAINADGTFTFPGGMPAGGGYTVTTGDTSCIVSSGTGTNVQANVSSVQVVCGGVVELASVTFASGVPSVPFTSTLTPVFDPGALVYSGTRPFFMDDVDMISVTPTATYPTQASISVYADPTTSGQASPPHALGAFVPVHLQHPPALDRTYQFTLLPGTPTETAFLKAPTPVSGDHFASVAISGNVLVVGAPGRSGTGAAFIYRRGPVGWLQEQIIQPTLVAGAFAAESVAIDGDVLVIGAARDAGDGSGRAYVYRYNPSSQSWVLDGGGVLMATSPTSGYGFGASVAISGTRIIVGSPAEKGSGNKTDAGAVYMFRYDALSSAWVSDGTFKGAATGDQLGAAVALSGDTALVGAAYEADGTATAAGGAHVLVRGASTWAQEGATLRGDVTTLSKFGTAVGISGDYAAVGASLSAGSVYVFHRVGTTWSLDGPKLSPMLLVPLSARFGEALAIDGTHLLVGAMNEESAMVNSGMVHAYRRDAGGWTTSAAVSASVPTVSRFGASVALDGEWFAVGAPQESTGAGDSGAVYVFR